MFEVALLDQATDVAPLAGGRYRTTSKAQNRMTKVLFSQPVLSFWCGLGLLHDQFPSEQCCE